MHRLESGLRVVVHTTTSGVSAVHLWFDAGAVDEPSAQAGAAHFVEHLLFKGTPTRGIGAAAAEIEGLGGDLNAWTSWDETVLHATVADGVDQAMDVLFDMARASTFDPDEMERERHVVIEELRSYQADPESVVVERLQQRVLGQHPYGRPIIGHEPTVTGISHAQLHRFWRRNYHPERALLVVAGPVSQSDVLDQARKVTRGWAPGASRSPVRPARHTRPGHEVIRGPFESIVVAMGWPGPPIEHPDEAALDVLAFGLGEGAAARLTVLLDLEHAVATQVWADASHWLGGGLISLGFGSHHSERAVGLTLRELGRVARHGLSASEIERAKRGILTDLWFAAESTHGIASELAWSAARLGDPYALAAYRTAIEQVTPEQVRAAAARWMSPNDAHIVVLDKSLKPETLRREVTSARRARAPTRKTADPVANTEVEDVGGIRVAVQRSDSPIAAVRMLAPGGQLHETVRTAGLAEAWARTVVRAAGPHDPRALAAEADAIALRLEATAGRTAQRLGGTFPADQLAPAMALLGDVLTAPQFDPSDWDQVRDTLIDDLRTMRDDADTIAYEAMWRALWPRHPFRFATLGTEASLRNITAHRLGRFHAGTMAAGPLVVGVAGGVDPDEVYRAVEVWAERISREPVALPRPTLAPPTLTPCVKRAGSTQAAVQLGLRGVAQTHPDRLALEVACGVLDSQAGRLFLALRETRGLAYSVWASSSANAVGGVVSLGLATDPARVAEATEGLHAELLRLAHEGPMPAELERTVRMLRGTVVRSRQRVASRASVLARALLTGEDPSMEALDVALAAVNPRRIQAALNGLDIEHPLRVTVLPP